MSSVFASYPVSSSGKVPTFSTFSAFPSAASVGNGSLAIALDTNYLYESNGTTWLVIGAPTEAISIGTFDSGVPSADGAHIDSTALIMQSASATNPGLVNVSTQTLTGVKTFVSAPVFNTALGISSGGTGVTALGNLTDAGTDGIVVTGGTGALVTSASLAQHVSDSTHNGYLSSADWSTFNAKQPADNYITALTGDVTAAGPGSVAAALTATTNATLTSLSGLTTASALSSVGTVTSGTWNATTLAINHGGTGQVTAAGAFGALSPLTTKGDVLGFDTVNNRVPVGSDAQVLTADSAQPLGVKWTTPTVGTVTSVAMTVPTFLSVAGSPVTSSGTLAVSLSGAALPVLNGGTGATTATGTGSVVLQTSPSLITPALGTPTAAILTNATGLSLTTGVTGVLPTANGGTGQNSTATFPTSGIVVTEAASETLTNKTISGASNTITNVSLTAGVTGTLPVANGGTGVTTSTGTGSTVLSTSPTLVTPALGTPSAVVLTSGTGLPLTTGVTGTLPIANGGTNQTSVPTAPAATTYAGWDANSNMSANAFTPGYTTTATAAGTTTLTVSSTQQQYFTGATTQTVTLPVTSTLVLGQRFIINNLSTGVVTVNSSGANTVLAMPAATTAIYTVILTSGTTAASWSVSYTVNGTGVLPVANGGTGGTTYGSNTILIGHGTLPMLSIAVNATATNKFLTNVSSGTPGWNTIASADLPVVSASQTGALSTGADTIAGAKTWNGVSKFVTGYYGNTPTILTSSTSITNPGTEFSPGSGNVYTTVSSDAAYFTSQSNSGGGDSSSTGTITITFARAGNYKIIQQVNIHVVTGVPTYHRVRTTMGGTATKLAPGITTNDEGGVAEAGSASDYQGVLITYWNATAAQTATFNTKGLTGGVVTAETLYCEYYVEAL